ncbi:MAG: hypothetical protein JO316_21510 [Abitibacteriaceae bacterium]|nr:hypothetical protein [Abditibacteriaceae bacterium]
MNRVGKTVIASSLVVGSGLAWNLKIAPLRAEPPSGLVPLQSGSLDANGATLREQQRAVRHQPRPRLMAPPTGTAKFGDPLRGLTTAQLAAFTAGKDEFTNVETIESGLGPIFNESSCVACHFTGATGGASSTFVTRFGRLVNGTFDPLASLGGSLLQAKAIDPSIREVVPSQANVIAHRQTTPLFGLGLIEAIPDDEIRANAVASAPPPGGSGGTQPIAPAPSGPAPIGPPPIGPAPINQPPTGSLPTNPPPVGIRPGTGTGGFQPRDFNLAADGILGRAATITDVVSGQQRVGRFGWKAQQATLLAFAGDAYLNEMGITNRLFPTENAPNGNLAKLKAFDHVKDIEDAVDPTTGRSDIDTVTDFMRYLAPPPTVPFTASASAGSVLFDNINCSGCHKPVMFTGSNSIAALDRKPVPLYSDLLLHDMGSLNDGIAQADAGTDEMRTPPLWGLRASAPYLHDGRAATIEAAILAHDGEALNARDRYAHLTPQQRQQILDFLNSI